MLLQICIELPIEAQQFHVLNFADAEWSDRVPYLVQAALVDSFEKTGVFAAVGSESLGVGTDFVLDTTIEDFQAVYDAATGPPRVVVKLAMTLIAMPERKIVSQTRVRAEQAATANVVPDIVSAFDAALGSAVRQAVIWTATNPVLSPRSGSVISRTRSVHSMENKDR